VEIRLFINALILYEQILCVHLDNRNFRKKILQMDYIEKLNEREKQVPHKPADYYWFNKRKHQKYKKKFNIFNL